MFEGKSAATHIQVSPYLDGSAKAGMDPPGFIPAWV